MSQNIELSNIKSITKKYLSLLDKEKDNITNTETMLFEYISTGLFSSSIGFPDVDPAYQLWESTYLETGLRVLAFRCIHSLELSCVKGGSFDTSQAGNAVMYMYFSQLVIHHIFALQLKRFGRRGSGKRGMEVISFAVLALLIGKKGIARNIFLLVSMSYKNDELVHRQYPIYCFMLKMLSDYFDEPLVISEGKSDGDILFRYLYDEWKNPEHERLKELCIEVCDYHLSRCKPDKGNKWYEFSNLSWSLWPIEITLLFKLREILGLENPHVNHSLMSSALGQLPEEKEFIMDDLLLKILKKMKSQGFDENEVLEKIYSNVN